MFDHLLNSSEEEQDEIIDEPDFLYNFNPIQQPSTSKSSISKSTAKSLSPKSLQEAYKNLLENLDNENYDVINTSDIPATETDEDIRSLNPVVLSFVIFENHIGAAYYNAETWEIFVMDDIYDTTFNISVIKTLYKQCLPRQIISVKGVSIAIIRQIQEMLLKSSSSLHSDDSMQTSTSISNTELKILPKNEYSSANCHSRVRILKLESEPPNMNMSERLLYLNSIINFKSKSMIYALGLLLNYIDKNWNLIDLNSGQPKYLCINHILLKDIVVLNEDAYEALDILRISQHPSFFKFGNICGQTNVNSLYALLNQCQSKPGSQRLWQMLHYPSKDIQLIRMRLDVIQFFLQPNNQYIAANLMSCLKRIHNISPVILNKTTALNCRPTEWKKFYETLYHVILIEDICKKNRQYLQMFQNIADSVTDEMHFIKYFVEYIIDFDESKRQNKITVKRGVDVMLDNLTDLRERLPEILTAAGSEEMENLPPEVENCRMLYFPDICYVLCVTKWKSGVPEDAEFPNMEYKFTINHLRHYKTTRALELDETIGDIQMKIQKRQSQIMTRLINYISQHVSAILNTLRQCIDLDVFLSFYTVALDHNYVKPEIVPAKVIEIKKSRHPLYELYSPDYVCNDIYSGNGASVFKIITGPNACGKSVYLKQIALIIFMAHLGCYVPAESATIGIVDHILTQISSSESAAFDASAFIQDLRQVNMIVHSATSNSLVIIDEFGKSTSEIDGLAIATSVMTNLIDRKLDCPHVFASTHMHNILSLLPRSKMVESQTFEYVIHADNTIVFLYRIVSGSVSTSYAHSVAKMCGIESSFIEESNKVFDKIKSNNIPTMTNKEAEEKKYLIRDFIHNIYHSKEIPSLDYIKEFIRNIRGETYSADKKDGVSE